MPQPIPRHLLSAASKIELAMEELARPSLHSPPNENLAKIVRCLAQADQMIAEEMLAAHNFRPIS